MKGLRETADNRSNKSELTGKDNERRFQDNNTAIIDLENSTATTSVKLQNLSNQGRLILSKHWKETMPAKITLPYLLISQ